MKENSAILQNTLSGFHLETFSGKKCSRYTTKHGCHQANHECDFIMIVRERLEIFGGFGELGEHSVLHGTCKRLSAMLFLYSYMNILYVYT